MKSSREAAIGVRPLSANLSERELQQGRITACGGTSSRNIGDGRINTLWGFTFSEFTIETEREGGRDLANHSQQGRRPDTHFASVHLSRSRSQTYKMQAFDEAYEVTYRRPIRESAVRDSSWLGV